MPRNAIASNNDINTPRRRRGFDVCRGLERGISILLQMKKIFAVLRAKVYLMDARGTRGVLGGFVWCGIAVVNRIILMFMLLLSEQSPKVRIVVCVVCR